LSGLFGKTRLYLSKSLAALVVAVLLALLACGIDSTGVPSPEFRHTTLPKFAPAPPSVQQLGGGSPEAFAKVFEDARASTIFRPTSDFAVARQPLAEGEKLKIGFIFVGSQRDLGFNQAVSEGSHYLEAAFSDIEVIRAENIPETADVQAVAEQMIRDGAKIIFPTSFGYSGPIKEIIDKHSDIMFLHLGDLEIFENYGSFFANIWQLEFAAGKAAGHATETGKLGFIAGFPIPPTMLNVNAFHLGARSVNPDVETTFVLTNDWCDPAKQATAVQTLVDADIDVITQHQDCTKTIVEAAERAGVWVTGYHYDASEAAPNAWLTGASWNWGPIIAEIVGEIRSGVYQSSIMLAGLEAGWVKLAPFGSSVSDDVRQVVLDTVEGLRDGSIKPFAGPVYDQNGNIRIPAGAIPTDIELQTLDWLVEGITGRTN